VRGGCAEGGKFREDVKTCGSPALCDVQRCWKTSVPLCKPWFAAALGFLKEPAEESREGSSDLTRILPNRCQVFFSHVL